jgi:hypothetical protein
MAPWYGEQWRERMSPQADVSAQRHSILLKARQIT